MGLKESFLFTNQIFICANENNAEHLDQRQFHWAYI